MEEEMTNEHDLEEYLKSAEDRIDWVLSHSGMSDWLKNALRGARERDPVEVLNDLEMLNHLLKPRAEAQIQQRFPGTAQPSDMSKDPRG
jgi:hypothetical protein